MAGPVIEATVYIVEDERLRTVVKRDGEELAQLSWWPMPTSPEDSVCSFQVGLKPIRPCVFSEHDIAVISNHFRVMNALGFGYYCRSSE